MIKPLSHLLQHHAKGKKGDTTQLAAQLAPLEEQPKPKAPAQVEGPRDAAQAGATQEYGAIVIGNEGVRLKEIMEGKSEGRFLGMEPVVLVILFFMLGFIAFIAWQISLMPRPE